MHTLRLVIETKRSGEKTITLERAPMDPWADEPAARKAVAALADALADAPPPLAHRVDELRVRRANGACVVSARRVHASPQALSVEPSCPSAALPQFRSDDSGELADPDAMLLMHVFALADAGADAPAEQRLRLTTLLLPRASPKPELLAAAFGADAHVALPAPEERAFTDVALELGNEFHSVSAAELAAWTGRARAALRAALRAQRLAATATCIEATWASGFLCLRTFVGAVEPELTAAFAGLTTFLVGALSAGIPTRACLDARTREAEALEAAGKYLEAAVLYKINIAADARLPAARLLQSPPQIWSHYGLALKRAGRYKDAQRAYEDGLRALTGPVDPDTPAWRESLRLDLLNKCISLAEASGDTELRRQACRRIFARQIAQLEREGDPHGMWAIGGRHDVLYTSCKGRRFAVVSRHSVPGDGQVTSLLSVVELSRVAPITKTREQLLEMEDKSNGSWNPQALAQSQHDSANDTLRSWLEGRSHAAAPDLPVACCAQCGKPAPPKRCAACGGPRYCDAACQNAHWKAHKPACKAACKAAARDAAGSAAAA